MGQRRSSAKERGLGAADVVVQMHLVLVSFGDAGVNVAASSYMQPLQEGFHIEKEKKWGEGVSLAQYLNHPPTSPKEMRAP